MCPAIGSCDPFSGKIDGSVVGTPSSSTSQVSGMGRPSFLAAKILVAATALVAMSSITVRSPPVGAAQAIGLVPRMRLLPPGTVMQGSTLHIDMPNMPCSAIMLA